MKKTERKQYLIYSCYAWGLTLLFLSVTVITNVAEGDHWKPGFGSNSCWFSGKYFNNIMNNQIILLQVFFKT